MKKDTPAEHIIPPVPTGRKIPKEEMKEKAMTPGGFAPVAYTGIKKGDKVWFVYGLKYDEPFQVIHVAQGTVKSMIGNLGSRYIYIKHGSVRMERESNVYQDYSKALKAAIEAQQKKLGRIQEELRASELNLGLLESKREKKSVSDMPEKCPNCDAVLALTDDPEQIKFEPGEVTGWQRFWRCTDPDCIESQEWHDKITEADPHGEEADGN